MILTKNYYSKVSFLKKFLLGWQTHILKGEKLHKTFNLHKTEWPNRLYFYSPRLKKKPVFVGTPELLSKWKDAKTCERICPTHAIEVTADAIIINHRGCISCGLCLEFAPEGLLAMS